ncbi:uncharacterized protein LOC136032440 [Artemia franciscana]|uniref:uncharacterized protein LOC136032433 n=1 Tax=Artemia franciscana TaxID=6661 RepID=UPI0032D9B10B
MSYAVPKNDIYRALVVEFESKFVVLSNDLTTRTILTRVQHTLKVILEKIEQSSLPVEKTWRLRGVVKHLDKLSDKAIMGIPFVDELDEYLKPIKCMQFLGD